MNEKVKSRVIEQGDGGDTKLVIEFTPKKFPLSVSTSASQFESSQKQADSDFQMNEIVAEFTGLADQRRVELEDKVEALTLEKLKSIEEKAYHEAYDLGLIEGTNKAFDEKTNEIDKRLADVDLMLEQMHSITKDLVVERENQIIKLINTIASKIAQFEIQSDQQKIIELIHHMLEEMQEDERVVIRVSPSDAEFLRQVRSKMEKDEKTLKGLKIEDDLEVTPGGCIMESNYGAVDATIEMRVARAWKSLQERLPRVKEDRTELIEKTTEESIEDNTTPEKNTEIDDTEGEES